MAIDYSTAEYGAPVWINSEHVTRIDSELNNASLLARLLAAR